MGDETAPSMTYDPGTRLPYSKRPIRSKLLRHHSQTNHKSMKTLTEPPTRSDCLGCDQRSRPYFCSLSDESLKKLSRHAGPHAYAKGATLFVQGEMCDGVYVLCSGRVKLITYSEEGRSIIVSVAEPGAVLGLPACVAGVAFEATARASAPCLVNFVGQNEFLDLLGSDPSVARNTIRELSFLYRKAHSQLCSLGLSVSASDKLGKLLLEWCNGSGSAEMGVHIQMLYTHEELAEMIGTSRETVTRLLKAFKGRGLIRLNGSDLFIPNPARLLSAKNVRKKMEQAAG